MFLKPRVRNAKTEGEEAELRVLRSEESEPDCRPLTTFGIVWMMLTPERIAREYIAASNRNDQQAMVDLFDDRAEWIPISPIEPRRGKAAISERYLTDVKEMNAPIVEDVYVSDAGRCVVEFVVNHPEHGRVPIVDVFDIDQAGLITRLAVYRQ